jgi:hypothetical protein
MAIPTDITLKTLKGSWGLVCIFTLSVVDMS